MPVPDGARIVDDPAELRTFFDDVPAVHIYALADLEPPFWQPSTWWRRGNAVVGFVRMPNSNAVTVYAVSTRDPVATLSLLVELAPRIEPDTLITAPIGLAEVLRPHFEVAWEGPHMRYQLGEPTAIRAMDLSRVEPLGSDRLDDLNALYDRDPGAAFFLPHMTSDDSFVGIYDDGQLIAAAGTHVLSTAQRCAAIGSVYTQPSHRGRGFGRLVTAGVIERIADRVDLIGLNVAEGNAPARVAYESLGFRPILTYAEAQVRQLR